QIKLIDQAVINFLDVSDTPEKADEYLTKLMVQLEELEGRFADFEEFIEKITTKREDIYNAFESRKVALIEARNKRASMLQQSAERIISSVKSRIGRFDSVVEINGYMSSDIMIDKIRKIVDDLREIGDSVKAEDILSKLKTTKEDAVRQLKDRSELYVDGEDLVKFGEYKFAVNKQTLDLTIIPRNGKMYYHLTGTNFFELIDDEEFNRLRELWSQELLSENKQIYRAEYLVGEILRAADDEDNDFPAKETLYQSDEKTLLEHVRKFMGTRYDEGYLKGVHDHDAALILQAVLTTDQTADLLRYPSSIRAAATLFWHKFLPTDRKEVLNHQLKGAGLILKVFPGTKEFIGLMVELEEEVAAFCDSTDLFNDLNAEVCAKYLFEEMSRGDHFILDKETGTLYHEFLEALKKSKATKDFRSSVKLLEQHVAERFLLIRKWINAYLDQQDDQSLREYADECATTLLLNDFQENRIVHATLKQEITDMRGDHELISDSTYHFDYNQLMTRLIAYQTSVVPRFSLLKDLKKSLAKEFSEELRLSEFKPRILSSFVRNQLIDEVYLPLIGANLAKQVGAAGDQKRTDLNGLLLLISPPGYGKTTLMEYIANRLGIIFMKINGPALGHTITSLDPGEAPNATSREELEKLNLAFEMGDNVMIYLDDIQHCNPELLQKFISLCDAQRKIEGVYKGRSKTYDFRGKKVCVIMAGNPYTESGEKFQIPDMLANRADIYNLGDIIGDTDISFKLSYLENSLTSNPILKKAAARSHADVLKMVKIAETGKQEGITFEANHSQDELSECIELLKKVLQVREIIFKVNKQYIASAAQSDAYRTEPPFKLQGSYRDMNKIVEKLVPVMNNEELQTLIVSHYQNESQTLTSGAEANLLKFKEMYGIISEEERSRWDSILDTFRKSQKAKGYGENGSAGLMIEQMESISGSLDSIRDEILRKMKVFSVAKRQRKGE
ncbi:MAG: AAA family ATPase, partial [Bacteroidota bacterium]